MISDYEVQNTIKNLSNDKLNLEIQAYNDAYCRLWHIRDLSPQHRKIYLSMKLKLALLREEQNKRGKHNSQ